MSLGVHCVHHRAATHIHIHSIDLIRLSLNCGKKAIYIRWENMQNIQPLVDPGIEPSTFLLSGNSANTFVKVCFHSLVFLPRHELVFSKCVSVCVCRRVHGAL